MKKQPRPTVTRMTRVWWPGRPSPMTAWRSGNHRTRASGCTRRTNAAPAPTRAMATTTKPPETNAPTCHEPACQAARLANSTRTNDRHQRLDRVEPRPEPARRAGAGAFRLVAQQRQRLDPADAGQRHERAADRHQVAEHGGVEGRRQRQARAGVAERDDGVRRHGRQAERRDQETERAPGEAEHQRLQDVDGEDPPARRAQALERGDAGPLLLQEDAGHAPHADAAEDEDHVADQAEEVLRALDLRADARLGVVVRAHRREAVAEASPQPLDDRLERRVGQLQQPLVADPAAEADEAGRGEIGAIDDDARPERERAGAAARARR